MKKYSLALLCGIICTSALAQSSIEEIEKLLNDKGIEKKAIFILLII
jgi:hypothetical protein